MILNISTACTKVVMITICNWRSIRAISLVYNEILQFCEEGKDKCSN